MVVLAAWIAAGQNAEIPGQIADLSPVSVAPEVETRILAFCGDCHALPRPGSFPRDRWHQAVRHGYEYYARSGRRDLDPPTIQEVVNYYRSRAPERFSFPVPAEALGDPPVRFTRQQVDWPRDPGVQPAIAYLHWASLISDQVPVLLSCDVGDGTVAALELRRGEFHRRVLATLEFPCHLEVCDLDGDGRTDLVVADLGSYFAADHERGRVVWLRPNEDGEGYEPIVIAAGLGRVSDIRPGDFNGDGRLDLLIAEFGHQRTGSIRLLSNVADEGEPLRFEQEIVDSRPGAIHLLPYDFTGDGKMDFAALISQHFESLELFVNQGENRFRQRPIWRAPDLTFGSSGIRLADLNQDGRMDILYTNGDTFDNVFANPSHGVQWLEDQGDLQFVYHRVADLTGAYNARAGDFDSDGRLDLVATAWLPRQLYPVELRTSPLASLVLLTPAAWGGWNRHTLEAGFPHYAALELGDFDGNGTLDLAVGRHRGTADSGSERVAPIAIWWNEGKAGLVD